MGVKKPITIILSSRENEIIRMVADGFTNGEIANALSLSENTIKSHLIRIYHKVGAKDRANCVYILMQRGMFPDRIPITSKSRLQSIVDDMKFHLLNMESELAKP